MSAVLLAALLASTYLGFALLALSQDRHWHHLGGARHCPAGATRILRPCGYGLLAVSLIVALLRDGASFGTLVWVTTLTIGAFAVASTLTWRPHWLRPLARAIRSTI